MERPAHDNAGIVGDQVDHAVLAHVDTVVKLQEMAEVDRGQGHAGKTAVRIIDPP
ncbi:hypothetical protein D3C85_1833840 [compost metagenome]